MRRGRVTATAPDREVDHVARGEERTRPKVDGAACVAGTDVDREGRRHGLDPGGLEEALAKHRSGAVIALLSGLEHEQDMPAELPAVVPEETSRPEQHGDVRVVSARMHPIRDLRGEVEAGLLAQRQAIHVGAQEQRRARPLPLDDRHHGAHGGPEHRLETKTSKRPGDRRLGLGQLEADLRPTMQVAADPDDLREERLGLDHEAGGSGPMIVLDGCRWLAIRHGRKCRPPRAPLQDPDGTRHGPARHARTGRSVQARGVRDLRAPASRSVNRAPGPA